MTAAWNISSAALRRQRKWALKSCSPTASVHRLMKSMTCLLYTSTVLTVTEEGKGRGTRIEDYRVQYRGGKGIRNYGEKGHVAGIRVISEEDDIILISLEGIIIRMHAGDINVQSRYGSGVRVMRLAEGDRVVTVARTERSDEEEVAKPEQDEQEMCIRDRLDSLGMALTTFTGQNFGAGKLARVRQSVRVGLAMGAAASVFVSIIMCLFSQPLLRMFTQEADVLALGTGLMHRVVPFYVTYIGLEIFSTVARGCGDALRPMLIMLSGICLLRIVWVIWVLPLSRNVFTLMWSYPVSWVLTSILFLAYYLHGGWLRRCQAKLEQKLAKSST